jgi:hypothetical protein
LKNGNNWLYLGLLPPTMRSLPLGAARLLQLEGKPPNKLLKEGWHSRMSLKVQVLSAKVRLLSVYVDIDAKEGEVHVPPFTNSRIVVPRESILCCGDEDHPCNNILREDLASKDW